MAMEAHTPVVLQVTNLTWSEEQSSYRATVSDGLKSSSQVLFLDTLCKTIEEDIKTMQCPVIRIKVRKLTL